MKLKEATISYKRGRVSKAITNSQDAYKIIFEHLTENGVIDAMHLKEHCYIFFLNRANQILGANLISIGSQDACIIDVKDVFRVALLACAHSIILVHNHPSGNMKPNMKPSNADIQITNKIKNAGEIMCIKLLDHIIIDSGEYNNFYSFGDNGMI
jgi:DNA repair protein RadC